MRYIDVTGKTEEEAIRAALSQLGLERDDVSVEILERSKSGFLGIGSSPARFFGRFDLDKIQMQHDSSFRHAQPLMAPAVMPSMKLFISRKNSTTSGRAVTM